MLTSVKEVLLDQLAACHDDESWFKPSKTILNDVSVNDAVRKAEDYPHSIWEIANHLIFWNEMWLNRFINNDLLESNTTNDETFESDHLEQNDTSWNETIRRLSNGFVHWREVITNCDESKLEKRVPNYFNAQWWGVISNLCIHNAYHIGQIMLLKKQVQKYRS
ncbi:DinB superfamily protein [Paenibacillus sp. yr247]|uniref:DinB family protein n=1 Tax=Paenibacillus sp. yr247 TaxID=1761880 RepID=UPI00088D3221|nr:DinB family protein [Paenibacillus sp. yr247]SDN68105.1 DinB superfamily protein [Paenibacillus sp. yr247]